MMKLARNLYVIIFICLYVIMGCENKDNVLTKSEAISSSEPSSVHTRRPDQAFYPQIVINDSLLELDFEEFNEEYAKIPDDYEIEILANVLYDEEMASEPISLNEESNTITKKQAEEVREVYWGDDELSFALSLKGLRFFPNVTSVCFAQCGIIDMEELMYLHNLDKVSFMSCSLGKDDGTDELKYLSGMNKLDLEISNCKLKDVDFLDDVPDLPESSLCFSSNQITDIRPLIKLKNVKYLDLSNNHIKNIKPLSRLTKVSELDLSYNNISNISPLANLKEVRILWLAYNQVKNINVLSRLKHMEDFDLTGNRVTNITSLKNIKLKVALRFGIRTSYPECQFSKLLDNGILDYTPISNVLEDYYFPKGEKTSNGELIYQSEGFGKITEKKILFEGTKHHFDMKIMGTEYVENAQRQYTFFTLNAKYDDYSKNKQPACNIIFFFKALGGNGEYNKAKGIVKCFYKGTTYLFYDYSSTVKVDNEEAELQYEMKHMQGDQPFALVKDLCKLTNKKYQVLKERKVWHLLYDRMIKTSVPSLIEVG